MTSESAGEETSGTNPVRGTIAPSGRMARRDIPSVWQTGRQWILLAWLGGILVGAPLLFLAFTSPIASMTTKFMVGGLFLLIVPGSLVTWKTWHNHRKRVDKDTR